MPLTITDITRLLKDRFYSDPQAVAQVVAVIAAENDPESAQEIMLEATQRGCDVLPHLRKHFEGQF